MGGHAEGVSYAERMARSGRGQGWMIRERTLISDEAEPDGSEAEEVAERAGPEAVEPVEPVGSEATNVPGKASAETSGWAQGSAHAASADVSGAALKNVSAEMSVWDTAGDAPPSGAGRVEDPGVPDQEPGDPEAGDPEAIDQEAIENDELEELGNEIATIAAHIHAAEYQLLVKLAEFDRRKGWEVCGFRNCAAWLAFRTGDSRGACRERVRAARALEKLPETSAAMAGGELSFSQVRALTRVATPENEAELLEYAESCSGDQLEVFLRGWRMHNARDERELARLRWEAREVVVWTEAEGTVQLRARLPAAEGLMVLRTLQAYGLAVSGEKGEEDGRTDRQRRADALLMLVERATAAGTGDMETDARVGLGAVVAEEAVGAEAAGAEEAANSPAEPLGDVSAEMSVWDREEAASAEAATGEDAEAPAGAAADQESSSGNAAEAVGDVSAEMSEWDTTAQKAKSAAAAEAPTAAEAAPLPISPTAERYLVMLHTEEKALTAAAEPERCHLDDGTRVAAETARRLTCDCSTVRVTRGADGSVLDVGRKTRQISTPMRRALEVRDRCCRFPGCNLRFVQRHHVLHWGDRGSTKLENLVLLCSYHHTLVHEGGFSMDMPLPGRPNFYDRRGKLVPDTPPPTRVSSALEALERQHRRKGGSAPGPYTASHGRYKFDRLVPWAVEARAREAVDPS